MADLLPTYEYGEDGVRAVFEDRVIASGESFSRTAAVADEYLESLESERKTAAHEAARKTATHITTPNGAKGEILNRVASVWGDEITVRFENGQIRRFATAAGDEKLSYTREEPEAPSNIREALQRELEQDYDHGVGGLTARLAQLEQIKTTASRYAASENSPVELQELHKIVLAVDHETQEVKSALDYLQSADTEAYMPPTYAAVEQADLGRAKGDTWLDVTAREMIAESENQDVNQLLREGPTVLVSAMEDAAIHDAGTVREAATNFIMARTAGFTGDKISTYREEFVARAEQARREQLRQRAATVKEAATKEAAENDSFPDEALFA